MDFLRCDKAFCNHAVPRFHACGEVTVYLHAERSPKIVEEPRPPRPGARSELRYHAGMHAGAVRD